MPLLPRWNRLRPRSEGNLVLDSPAAEDFGAWRFNSSALSRRCKLAQQGGIHSWMPRIRLWRGRGQTKKLLPRKPPGRRPLGQSQRGIQQPDSPRAHVRTRVLKIGGVERRRALVQFVPQVESRASQKKGCPHQSASMICIGEAGSGSEAKCPLRVTARSPEVPSLL